MVVANTSKSAIASLYRSFRRQINLLPTEYLRQFFRIKLGDDVRAAVETRHREDLRRKKVKRIEKELRKMQDANSGRPAAMSHILNLAYGRKGKLRWEIMEPLLSDPIATLPERIIPAVEKSRPPVYSPELTALLTSSLSRTSKPLTPKALSTPPSLPPQADPNSEEARLLGPFSKRREVNTRWRFFTEEWKKVYPPLQVTLNDRSEPSDAIGDSASHTLIQAGARGFGFQHSGVLEELLAIAGPRIPPPMTRRQKQSSGVDSSVTPDSVDLSNSPLPPRFIRRRYRELLSTLPILTYTPRKPSGKDARPTGKYSVSLSPNARADALRFTPARLPEADEVDLAWIKQSQEEEKRLKQAVKK